MAVIKPSALVQSVSGSLGGLTFAQGKRGAIVRVKPPNRTGSSPPQLDQRALMSMLTNAWRTLTDENRQTWINAARGQSMTPTGSGTRPLDPRLFFFRQNTLAHLTFGAIYTAFPDIWPRATPFQTSLQVYNDGPAIFRSGNVFANPPGWFVVRAQRPFSTHPGKPARSLDVVWRGYCMGGAVSIDQANPIYPAASALGLFPALGVPGVGEYIWYEAEQWAPAYWGTSVTSGSTKVMNLGPNKVQNGNFEADAPGDLPATWERNPVGSFKSTSVDAWLDARSAQYVVNPGVASQYVQARLIPSFDAGQQYTLTFSAKQVSGYIQYIQFHSGGGGNINIAGPLTPPADSLWHEFSYTFTNDVSRYNPYLRFFFPASVVMDVSFDNIQLRKVL